MVNSKGQTHFISNSANVLEQKILQIIKKSHGKKDIELFENYPFLSFTFNLPTTTKIDLIESIHKETLISKEIISKVIDCMADTIIKKVSGGELVVIKGFGTFLAKKRAERSGRNPKTDASLIIESCTVPRFRAGKIFKEAVNK